MELQDGVAVVSAAIGIGGLLFGLRQYSAAEKWKRSEFAAKHLEELSGDARLQLCCKMLDWSIRRVPVPEEYRALTPEQTFVHDWRILAEAMAPESPASRFEWQHTLYRDLFDHFFEYLERIEHYLSIGLFSVGDVSSLRYWLAELADPRFLDGPDKLVFFAFLRRYEYDGVLALMRTFGIGVPAELEDESVPGRVREVVPRDHVHPRQGSP